MLNIVPPEIPPGTKMLETSLRGVVERAVAMGVDARQRHSYERVYRHAAEWLIAPNRVLDWSLQ